MNDKFYSWIMFLISPFVSMILAFKDYTATYSRNIFWAFCTFYGLTFAIGGESDGSDILFYINEMKSLYLRHELTVYQAIELFKNSGEVDVFKSIISFMLSRFTDNQAVLTMVYAFIFGFFFSRNIWYVFSIIDGKLNGLTKLLLLALILVVPIWNINGVRMYLAFHVFMYGLLPFIFENRKHKLVFCFASFLIHFSFLIPISVLLVFLLVGTRLNIYFIIFVASIFVSEFEITQFNQIIDTYVPDALAQRSAGYRNEQVVEEYKEGIINVTSNWYSLWYHKGLRWSLTLILIYLFSFSKYRIKTSYNWKKILSFCLLFFAISNFLSNVPSGSRFYIFAFFLTLTLIILYLNKFQEDSKFLLMIQVLSPAILLFIVISFRLGLYNTSLSTILANPIIALFSAGETIPINDLIK